jgi:signal transduction histidine kinase
VNLSERSKLWILVVSCLVFAQACASVLMPPGFALTVFSDVTQCILLLGGVATLVPNIVRNHGRARLFWTLMTVGVVFWLSYQVLWGYIEVILRQDVPDPFVGDIVLFLHLVPMMAAIALVPHSEQNEHTGKLGRLDFVLLLTWWVYLYLVTVLPWQYAQTDELAYSRNLNSLYLTEKLVFQLGLALVWFRSKNGWRTIYANWFGASLMYALSSYVANWAIQRNLYYTGSLYDLPLAASMAWVSAIGILGQDLYPKPKPASTSQGHGVWVARLSMLVIFSLPLLAGRGLLDTTASPKVRTFRVAITLATMLVMGGIVFIRQHLLDRELIRLLHSSQESFENLKLLQTQLIQSEKLASLGQLVGGAAHELNNPLTAMLGYTELLAASGLTDEPRTLAQKTSQQVRRAKILISSLLNFARQGPADRIAIDLNAVAQTALKLAEPQFSTHKINLDLTLSHDLPRILADPNQLLQVCLHIASNALNALDEAGGGTLHVRTYSRDTSVILEFSDQGTPPASADRSLETESHELDESMGPGLNACYGIVREHEGRIFYVKRADGTTNVRIELPTLDSSRLQTALEENNYELARIPGTGSAD